MALTIKTKSKGLLIPTLDLKKMIDKSIKSLIANCLSLRRETLIKWVEYFPTYTICEHTSDKTLSSMYLRVKHQSKFSRLSAREIEMSGASIVEFIDCLEESGAKQIATPENMLEII